MTSAEFVAACFWPVAILLSGLLWFVRDTALRRWFAIITAMFLVAYLFLWLAYGQSSLIEVIDEEIFLAVLARGHSVLDFIGSLRRLPPFPKTQLPTLQNGKRFLWFLEGSS